MKIEQDITAAVVKAVETLYGATVDAAQIQLQKTKREFEGSLTLVVFPLLRVSRKKPEDTASDIGAYLKENCHAVADYNVIKGFLNLTVSHESWLEMLENINADESYGTPWCNHLIFN